MTDSAIHRTPLPTERQPQRPAHDHLGQPRTAPERTHTCSRDESFGPLETITPQWLR
jgi:hypothetical protein